MKETCLHKTDRHMDVCVCMGGPGREGDVRTFILCEDSRILIFENQHSLRHNIGQFFDGLIFHGTF